MTETSDIRGRSDPPRVDDSVTVHGAERGRAVILVHGSMDRQAAFRRLLKYLPDHRCVTYDRRGYAKSRFVGPPFTVDDNVEDLRRIVEIFSDHGPPIVVGHSFGGVVALTLAARHPRSIGAIAVYESPMSWVDWWPKNTGGAAVVAGGTDPEAAAEGFLKRFIGEERWQRLPERTRVARRSEGRALVDELTDLRRAAPYSVTSLVTPLVSGVGSRASEHVRRAAEILATRSTTGGVVVVPDGPHNAPTTHPERFVELVVRPALSSADDLIG